MVNVVQQGWNRNYYNVWEDVDLTKNSWSQYIIRGSLFSSQPNWTIQERVETRLLLDV